MTISGIATVVAAGLHDGRADLSQHEVRVLSIDGVINPLSARYLTREVNRAIHENADAVILELDSPGGLESSMREMVQTMLNSTVPIVVYVTPHGARAASAGVFLTMAAHVAVMAPGTNIGAAHPVRAGNGGKKNTSRNDVLSEKALSDAAALARSVATERGRNAEWAEKAVRESDSMPAHEAVKANVVDLIAVDRNDLLRQLNGRRISLASRPRTLHLDHIYLVEVPMRLPEKILQAISDPNIAYLLVSIGIAGIIAELYSPGLYFPGLTGVICLLLGFASMGSLPLGWVGLVLLLLGILLLFLETLAPGIGVFGVTGFAAFILGSLMLYSPIGPVSPALPVVKVSPWIIGSVATGFLVFIVFVMRALIQSRRLPVSTGRAVIVGKTAIATTDLSPAGVVTLDHEKWSAVIEPNTATRFIRAGNRVKVVDLEGPILKVRKL
jgi:membrane-bound serine protease (ClpP class)